MTRAALTVLLAVWAGAGAQTLAEVSDVTADFSISNGNPNGLWTYGWMPTDFSSLIPHPHCGYTGPGGSPNWYRDGGGHPPNIFKNTTPHWHYQVPPGWISLHPGPSTEPSVARWTAPAGAMGLARVAGEFLPGDGGQINVGVRLNTQWLWQAVDSGNFDLNVAISPGDTIDFVAYGGYLFGNTPLTAQIHWVPEPATLAALGVGLLPMVGRRYDRRRRVSAA